MFADTGKTIPEVAGSKRKSVDRQKTPEKFSKVTKRKKGYGSAVKGINYTHILQSLWSFMIFLLFMAFLSLALHYILSQMITRLSVYI